MFFFMDLILFCLVSEATECVTERLIVVRDESFAAAAVKVPAGGRAVLRAAPIAAYGAAAAERTVAAVQ